MHRELFGCLLEHHFHTKNLVSRKRLTQFSEPPDCVCLIVVQRVSHTCVRFGFESTFRRSVRRCQTDQIVHVLAIVTSALCRVRVRQTQNCAVAVDLKISIDTIVLTIYQSVSRHLSAQYETAKIWSSMLVDLFWDTALPLS